MSETQSQGGRRPGAGRPPGSKNRKSAEIAREAMEAGITPIEVMLSAMRDLWDEGTSEAKREAARIAKDAAPYVHPRLATIDQTVHEPVQFVIRVPEPCLTTEEWQARVEAGWYDTSKRDNCLSTERKSQLALAQLDGAKASTA